MGRSHFTFRGLRSLMQLKGLCGFAISRYTCLFRGVRSSDADEYNDIAAFQGCDDPKAANAAGEQHQREIDEQRRENDDKQHKIDEQRRENDGKQRKIEKQEYDIGWQQHEIVELQRMVVDQHGEIIDQQREIADLQQEVRRLRQQKRYRQQEQWDEDWYEHRHSRRRR
uniref:Uncharacterized protein n=1 Tax=Tetradesmus obliquus TaxID=3088 RepID=A0A383VFA5_TETOB|eukprot:jgi/Sobl393_1/12726/SZX63610.1